jgi:hypothetical protein
MEMWRFEKKKERKRKKKEGKRGFTWEPYRIREKLKQRKFQGCSAPSS